MTTESTDDAFVSGHVTYVSPRVEGLVTEVMVEQNDRVVPGTILARLDREPFVIALEQAEASLVQARANLELSKASIKAQLASARGAFFQRKGQQEQLSRLIRSLESQVATLRASQSAQHLAELDQRRLANPRRPRLGDAIGAGPAEQHARPSQPAGQGVVDRDPGDTSRPRP